ncbi:protein of unknown function [Xenorhabdus poinarii G6]|uniref:Uncharacterized protein n=1 Tax=Xenorhabdus poinarii G6 TaxID=1354304 RepID=A0A068R5G0_9GAMM|nr:protein of unknown function [Xenorhabdus poinarii G6]
MPENIILLLTMCSQNGAYLRVNGASFIRALCQASTTGDITH